MSVILTVINAQTYQDFGDRLFVPGVYDLSDEYTYDDIRKSDELLSSLLLGYVEIVSDGTDIENEIDFRNISSDQDEAVVEVSGVVALNKVYVLNLTGNISLIDIPNIESYNKIEIRSTKKADIKGIKADGLPKGFTIVIHNVSNHEIKLKKNQGSVSPPYRFDFEPELKLKKKSFGMITRNDGDVSANNHRWNRENEN